MSNNKQSSVEYLIEQVKSKEWSNMFIWHKEEIFEQAKQMEKEQIIETWHNGYHAPIPMIDEENCGQQYYNETFNKEK